MIAGESVHRIGEDVLVFAMYTFALKFTNRLCAVGAEDGTHETRRDEMWNKISQPQALPVMSSMSGPQTGV
jgi:hypothetical protein